MASSAPSTAQCKQGGTLTVAFQDPVFSLSPLDGMGNGNEFVQIPLYDTLVSELVGKKDPQPDLATSWDISSDGLTYTFHLRSGVKFSDGSPVTAQDVLFTMNQLIDPKVDIDWYFVMTNVKSFEIMDPSTIVMHMKTVDASILWSLALPGAGIYPESVFKKLGTAAFARTPVGSGPFMLSKWAPDQYLKYVRNPYYWGTSYLDGITFNYLPDPTARALAVESGAADIAENIAYDQIAEVTSHPDVKVPLDPIQVGWFITLNEAVKPLDEKVVRQALNYATPRDVINRLVLGGVGTPSNSMQQQGGEFWDPSIPPYTYDLDKAKALMAQSSVPNGFTLNLTIKNHTVLTSTFAILQSEWAKIGVKLTVTIVDPSVSWDLLNKEKFQAMMEDPWAYTSDVPDDNEEAALYFLNDPVYHSWFSQYDSAQTISLVHAADGTIDPSKRQSLYSQLQKQVMDDAPSVTLLRVPGTNANSTKLLGAGVVLTDWWRFEGVCFKS